MMLTRPKNTRAHHADNQIQSVLNIETTLQDSVDMIALGEEEGDADVVVELNPRLLPFKNHREDGIREFTLRRSG